MAASKPQSLTLKSPKTGKTLKLKVKQTFRPTKSAVAYKGTLA